MAARLSALRAGRLLPPGRFVVLISIRGWVDPRARMLLEGLGQLIKPMTSSEIEIFDFSACCVAPQQTALPRAPAKIIYAFFVLRPFCMFISVQISWFDGCKSTKSIRTLMVFGIGFACLWLELPAIHSQHPNLWPGGVMASEDLVGRELRLFPVKFITD
jgi:hypothetical protein